MGFFWVVGWLGFFPGFLVFCTSDLGDSSFSPGKLASLTEKLHLLFVSQGLKKHYIFVFIQRKQSEWCAASAR